MFDDDSRQNDDSSDEELYDINPSGEMVGDLDLASPNFNLDQAYIGGIDSNNWILKKMERKERKIREENQKKDPARQKLLQRGSDFLGNIKFFNDQNDQRRGKFAHQNQKRVAGGFLDNIECFKRAKSSCSSSSNEYVYEEIPNHCHGTSNMKKEVWQRKLYLKIT